MSNSPVQLDKEIDIAEVEKHIIKLKDAINKGNKAGAYDLEEVPAIIEHLNVFKIVTLHLQELQNAVKHIRRQSEIVKQAENLAPITPTQPVQPKNV